MKKLLFCFFALVMFNSCKQKGNPDETETVKQPEALKLPDFKANPHLSSTLDALSSNNEILDYIIKKDSNFRGFYLPVLSELSIYGDDEGDIFKGAALKNNIKGNVYKADFDNNGYTDLLLLGAWGGSSSAKPGRIYFYNPYVFMNYGDSLKAVDISKMHRAGLPVIEYSDKEPVIKIIQPYVNKTQRQENKKSDSISYMKWVDIGFAELNKKPMQYDIEKIQYATSPCYGTCPLFELHIDNNGSVIFLADQFNDNGKREIAGDTAYKGKFTKEEYDKLTTFINYIDFPSLSDSYSVSATDMRFATLIITYRNGKEKHIEDYGFQGTYGLMALYDYFSAIRFSKKWEAIKDEPKGIRINTWYTKGLK